MAFLFMRPTGGSVGRTARVPIARQDPKEAAGCRLDEMCQLHLSDIRAMNRQLLKGPRLLLFDDPVVHVDDLNVLSFLDYLREVTIQLERQVFFTTANRKQKSRN